MNDKNILYFVCCELHMYNKLKNEKWKWELVSQKHVNFRAKEVQF